jgi:hypothetical protein
VATNGCPVQYGFDTTANPACRFRFHFPDRFKATQDQRGVDISDGDRKLLANGQNDANGLI